MTDPMTPSPDAAHHDAAAPSPIVARVARVARQRARARGVRGGFSLLEITLVLAIIGVLMAVAAVNIVGAAQRANKRATESSLDTIATGLQSYHLENSSTYPPGLQTLVDADYLEPKSLTDAWGQSFFYQPQETSEGNPFQLLSGGPDKEVGTGDDIDYWVLQEQQSQPQ